MLEELVGDVLVALVLASELEGDLEQVQAVHAHPARRVGLLEDVPAGERRRAVEDADVVEAEEAALEDVAPLGVLAVHPPREVQHQLVEDALEKAAIAPPRHAPLDLIDALARPRVDGWVHVTEGPLVRGELPVRVHVPLAREQGELLLGELGVEERDGDGVKREIPRRVPGVLPLVGHREDLTVEEVGPLGVLAASPLWGRRGALRVAAEPALDVEAVELLRPEEPSGALTKDARLVFVETFRHHRGPERVGFAFARFEGGIEPLEGFDEHLVDEAQADDRRLAFGEIRARRRRHTWCLRRVSSSRCARLG